MVSLTFFIKAKLGLYARKTPAKPWELFDPQGEAVKEYPTLWRARAPALPISQIPRDYLSPWLENYAMESGHSPVDEAKAIALGNFRLTSSRFMGTSFPPLWNQGFESVAQQHWSKISLPMDDKREVAQELSRFTWALVLVRAWILDGDDSHAENFWRLFEDWLDKNQPHLGPQWCSDEEVARRLMTVSYVVQAFRHHPATTEARIIKAARLISVSAQRLQATFAEPENHDSLAGLYAKVGLYSAGALWPRLPESDIWRSDGLEAVLAHLARCLKCEGITEFAEVASEFEVLQLVTWLETVLRSEKETLPESHHQNISALMTQITERVEADNLGAGTFSFPACEANNGVSVLIAAQILFTGKRANSSSADETSLLLNGPLSATAN
jgi:hypothetical protein